MAISFVIRPDAVRLNDRIAAIGAQAGRCCYCRPVDVNVPQMIEVSIQPNLEMIVNATRGNLARTPRMMITLSVVQPTSMKVAEPASTIRPATI